MRRQLNRKIQRIGEKLFVVARRPEVMFLMPDNDIDGAKRQRYGADILYDSRLLIVTFRLSQEY